MAFVDEAVVFAADADEVVDVGGSALGPPPHVMWLGEPGAAAAGEAAAAVAAANQAAEPAGTIWDV
jgi:hypothetical protein